MKQTLVIKRAEHRTKLVPELPLRCGRSARVVSLLVFPGLDDGEVVWTTRLLPDIEAQIARALAALFSERIERCDHLVLARRWHVDMADHVDRALCVAR